MKMDEFMKSILCRVLSEEIAHQEQWKENDIKLFGSEEKAKETSDRDEWIKRIKEWMKENDIKFSYDHYLNAR